MAYDFKREFRNLYQPKAHPSLVDVPAMTFVAGAGPGAPNAAGGADARALARRYAVSSAGKMSQGELAARGLLRLRGASA